MEDMPMKSQAQAAVKKLIDNAKRAEKPEEAVQWSHAATNVAYAYATFNSVPSPAKSAAKEPAPSAE